MNLRIQHTPEGSDEFLFTVTLGDETSSISLPSPNEINIPNHNISLTHGLRWYLEKYLEVPVELHAERAQNIQVTLQQWGYNCLNKLLSFNEKAVEEARASDFEKLNIAIESKYPAVLAWPWEALNSLQDGFIAQKSRIERRIIDDSCKPFSVSEDIPTKHLNILYVISRPHKGDIGYQTLARPLTELLYNEAWPVNIDVLRPATLHELRSVLKEKPNHYHILHFDGHGMATQQFTADAKSTGGMLIFEGKGRNLEVADLVSAVDIGEILKEAQIPCVVLNACQSAAFDEAATDPFATVATTLLQVGVHNVVAMSYSLWLNGANAFVPEFYKQLFEHGDISNAVLSGRNMMYQNCKRDTFIGSIDFYDWIVPVLYSNNEHKYKLPKLVKGAGQFLTRIPVEAKEIIHHNFIGRSSAIQQLERLMLRETQAGMLIYGMAGEGKTTLARGFLQWLDVTGGLENKALWFSFDEIRSAAQIIDEMIISLLGAKALLLSSEEKEEKLVSYLRGTPLVIVWDNFEYIFDDEDKEALGALLNKLCGGKTKIIIACRTSESWLHDEICEICVRLHLEGFQGAELWHYCNVVADQMGITINRNASAYKALIEKLQGHPMAIKIAHMGLKEQTPEELLKNFEEGSFEIGNSDLLLAVSSMLDKSLISAYAPILRLFGLHERFIDLTIVKMMLSELGEITDNIKDCFTILENAGLCHEVDRNIWRDGYRTHPALRQILAKRYPASEADKKKFVKFMANVCNKYESSPLPDKRRIFEMLAINFKNAAELALKMDMHMDVCSIYFGLGVYAHNRRHFTEAEYYYKAFLAIGENKKIPHVRSVGYHQLGLVTREKWGVDVAEQWFNKALDVQKQINDEQGMANTYHQLGLVAGERNDFETAEKNYKKSLEIFKKIGDKDGAAASYHQLGLLAQRSRDYTTAKMRYMQSLELKKEINDLQGAAATCHQLGLVAFEEKDYPTANYWLNRAIDIAKDIGDSYTVASSYIVFGNIEYVQKNYDDADKWYNEALILKLQIDDENGVAVIYHQLGMIAQARKDYGLAEKWYEKSLAIKQRMGNLHSTATSFYQKALLSMDMFEYETAEKRIRQALEIYKKFDDKLGIASSYSVLGMIIGEQGRLDESEMYIKKGLLISIQLNDQDLILAAEGNLRSLMAARQCNWNGCD